MSAEAPGPCPTCGSTELCYADCPDAPWNQPIDEAAIKREVEELLERAWNRHLRNARRRVKRRRKKIAELFARTPK